MVLDRRRAVGAVLAVTLALGGGAALVRGPATAADNGAPGSVAPARSVDLRIERVSPKPETYGVGIVVRIILDRNVPTSARTAVTDRITVSSTVPIGEAGWAWTDRRTAVFRPRGFWPAHAEVTVRAQPTGEVIGQKSGRDLRWAGAADSSFRIGPSRVMTIDARTDQATVVRDGALVRTIPVSLGMPGWETRSGTKVLMEKYRVKRMTSQSIGAEDPYILDAPNAIRLTATGEFIHAAAWATSRLGVRNGSHGCTNVSQADARWLYKHHLYGDPVITTGTSRPMEVDNGAGGVWNVPWETWLTGYVK
ncbi:MAG: L,D-transpeptidase [Candidatus Nanopelagicales bacterium]